MGNFNTGRFGKALIEGDYTIDASQLSVEYANLFPCGPSDKSSVSFWILPKTHGNHTFFNVVPTNGGSGEWSFEIKFENGRLSINDDVEGSHNNHFSFTIIDLATRFPLNVWSLITWTDIGDIYINNLLEDSYGSNGTGCLDFDPHIIKFAAKNDPIPLFTDINYVNGDDKDLTNPEDANDTDNTNLVPCVDSIGEVRLFIGALSWKTPGSVGTTTDWTGQNSSTPINVYGSLLFRTGLSGTFTTFASGASDGLKTFTLPRLANGDNTGGTFKWFYHSVAWTFAFNGLTIDIVIALSGAVYKGSISASNLVVDENGIIGPAGGSFSDIAVLSIDDAIIWDIGRPNFTYFDIEGFEEPPVPVPFVPIPPPPASILPFNPPLVDMIFYTRSENKAEWDTAPEKGAPFTESIPSIFFGGRFGSAMNSGQFRLDLVANSGAWNTWEAGLDSAVSFWINPSNYQNGNIIDIPGGDNSGEMIFNMSFKGGALFIRDEEKDITVNHNGFTTILLSDKFPLGNWTHVLLTWDDISGGTAPAKIYINGVEEYSYDVDNRGSFASNIFVGGATLGARIDDFIAWNTKPVIADYLSVGYSTVFIPPPSGGLVFHSKAENDSAWTSPFVGTGLIKVGTPGYTTSSGGKFGEATIGAINNAWQIDMSQHVLNSAELSVGIWFKPTAAFFTDDGPTLFSLGGNTNGFPNVQFVKSLATTFMQYQIIAGGAPYSFGFNPATQFTAGVYAHIGFTMRSAGLDAGASADTFRFFVNGVVINSSTAAYTGVNFKPGDIQGHFGSGADLVFQHMRGDYDNAKIYDTEQDFSGYLVE